MLCLTKVPIDGTLWDVCWLYGPLQCSSYSCNQIATGKSRIRILRCTLANSLLNQQYLFVSLSDKPLPTGSIICHHLHSSLHLVVHHSYVPVKSEKHTNRLKQFSLIRDKLVPDSLDISDDISDDSSLTSPVWFATDPLK